MKAYYLETNDADDGMAVVFADTPSQAKNQIHGTDIWYEGDWTELRVRRAKKYDGMENCSQAELALKQWHDGWEWFDRDNQDPDNDSDETFLKWYKDEFERGK